MQVLPLPAEGFQRERWRNGAGWTRQVLRVPDTDHYDWRASIAEIDRDCTFSRFPGHDRLQALLSGDGATLRFGDGRSLALEPPHGRIAFSGDDAPECSVQGRVQVFNLVLARGRARAELLHRPLVGPMVFFPEAGVQWLLLQLSGRARLADAPEAGDMETGDALLLWPETDAPRRLVLSGGGEVLLARIASAPRG